MGRLLPLTTCLRTLILGDCGIGPIGGEAVFNGLTENATLTRLDVSKNYLTGYVNTDEPPEEVNLHFCRLQVLMKRRKILRLHPHLHHRPHSNPIPDLASHIY